MANILGNITVDEVDILEVDGNPSSGAGTVAPTGSLAIVKNVGGGIFELWQKTGTPDTAWNQFKTGTSVGGNGVIRSTFNGTANPGRFLEFGQNISSNESPYHPASNTTLRSISADTDGSSTVTFEILKNDVQIETLVITSSASGEKVGLSHSVLVTDKIKIKVLSGSASKPVVYLYFG